MVERTASVRPRFRNWRKAWRVSGRNSASFCQTLTSQQSCSSGMTLSVAGKNERLFQFQPTLRVGGKALHPAQFVRVLLAIDRVAIWQVERADADDAAGDGEDAFDKSSLLVRVVARQTAVDFVRFQLGKQRNAVEAFLAVRFDVIAERFDLKAREVFIDRLDLLQADDVRVRILSTTPAGRQFAP